jgi:hypothetical protein
VAAIKDMVLAPEYRSIGGTSLVFSVRHHSTSNAMRRHEEGAQIAYALKAKWCLFGLRSSDNRGSSCDELSSVAIDATDNIYVAGVVAGPGDVDFGDGIDPGVDLFVASRHTCERGIACTQTHR